MSDKQREVTGLVMMLAGFALSALIYFVTSAVFFSKGENFLGLVQLLVPPAELVLPWLVSRRLGTLSIMGMVLMIAGSSLARKPADLR